MDSYEVQWKKSAELDLRSIARQQIIRIIKTIESLATNPFSLQSRKLSGTEEFYRVRVGDYRVIYQVGRKKKIVIIYYIRHRREAYRRIK